MTVEYTDCISAEEWNNTPNEFPGYDIKPSDGEVPALIWNVEYLFIAMAPRFILTRCGNTWLVPICVKWNKMSVQTIVWC